MSPSIDLNADLGEGFPWDAPLLDLVTSTSVCCGAHAGDPDTIRQTLSLAAARGVSVGAHPGYADREGFGRRDREVSREEVRALVVEQVGQLWDWAGEAGVALAFLKPHGALYNQGQREEVVADGLLDAATELDLPLLGQPRTFLEAKAEARGVRFIGEGFPDRRYEPDGRLVARTDPNATLYDPEEVRANVARLLADGVQTLCVHGDDPRAVDQAGLLRALIAEAGVSLRGLA